MKYTAAKKFVLKFYPDAKCLEFSSCFEGKQTRWKVICAEFAPHFHGEELGASSENEELAWINAVPHVKDRVQCTVLEQLES